MEPNTEATAKPAINQAASTSRAKEPSGAAAPHPKARKPAKQEKLVRRPGRSAPTKSQKLVCRYCGSDDLAPSFKKRRDARCRACFKKRYGSTARGKKTRAKN